MVIHADGGEITVEITPEKIDMILDDKGPGIKDVELAMQAGYSTAPDEIRSLGFGAGMGLPNMKKIFRPDGDRYPDRRGNKDHHDSIYLRGVEEWINSIIPCGLDPSLCKGCINCIKRCPTEAIRVRGERQASIKSSA